MNPFESDWPETAKLLEAMPERHQGGPFEQTVADGGTGRLDAAGVARDRAAKGMEILRTLRAEFGSGIGPSRPTMRLAGPTPAQLTRMRAGPCLALASFSAATAPSALAA